MSVVHSDENRLPPATLPRRQDCPHCGANCWTDEKHCWHCRRALDGPPARPRFLQFSIGTILVLMSGLAVGLSILRSFPFAAAVLAIWIFPAGLHTFAACRILRRRVPAVDFGEKVDRFALALVYTALILLGLCVFTCAGTMSIHLVYGMLGMSQDAGFVLAMVSLFVPAAPAIGIGGWVFWITLPRSRPEE